MPQLFSPAMTLIARATLVGIPLLALAAGIAIAYVGSWSDWATYRWKRREQPVPFSHEHHVGGLGIDCRYCHSGVEASPIAGVPPVETCMSCHSQMWFHAPMVEPVRAAWLNNTPIQWNRVHDLPDYAYFDHSVHIAKGVGCSTCHGDIATQPLTQRVVNMQMRWCIDCHREPEKHLRPPEEIFNPTWTEPSDQLARGRELVAHYHIQKEQLTNCSLCHR
jgi:hypothetical protein